MKEKEENEKKNKNDVIKNLELAIQNLNEEKNKLENILLKQENFVEKQNKIITDLNKTIQNKIEELNKKKQNITSLNNKNEE